MKKKILIIAGVLGIAAIAVLVFKPFSKKTVEYAFETSKVQKGLITNTVTATGTIEATTTINVGTQVSGIIQRVYVDFNDKVKQGQLLAKLDETALRAQLEQSQASVDQAQAQLNYQEATYNRLKVLYDKSLIAQADYDQAVYNYENSKATLSNARSSLARAKVNLEYATIYSPIEGVVLNRAVEEGQTVAASFNTPTLFTIVNDLTQMEVQTSVDEADIGKVKQGQRVEFTVDAYPDMQFKGTVSQVRLQPVTTNNVVTYVVVLNAPNPDKKLMPGMTASATIYVEEKQNALFVTGKALRFTPPAGYLKKTTGKSGLPRAGNNVQAATTANSEIASAMPGSGDLQGISEEKKIVWIRNEKGDLRPVPVTTGIDNGTDVEILAGLNEGEEVVISAGGNPAAKTATAQNGRPRGPFPF